jgi:hypothetical protein
VNKELTDLWIAYLAPSGSVWLFGDIINLTMNLYPEMTDNVQRTQECKYVLEMYKRIKESPVMAELE